MAKVEKFVPLDKRSKKEQRAYHAQQRGSWNGVNPVTRVVPSKKVYSRKRAEYRKFDPDAPSAFSLQKLYQIHCVPFTNACYDKRNVCGDTWHPPL